VTSPPRWKVVLIVALLGLTLLSWGAATAFAKFPDRTYPIANGTSFTFTSNFNSSLLDYQWVFSGEGTYQVNTTGGYIQLSAVGTYDRAYLYRGWQQVIDGFHSSNATTVSLDFRFVGFARNASTMIISRMNGGWFGAQETGGVTNFVYFDEVNNTGHVLTGADNNWQNLTVTFMESQRVVQLDDEALKLNPVNFTRLILGNPDYTPGLGGYVQFSNVTVTQSDFPSLQLAWYVTPVVLLAPMAVVAAAFVLGTRREPLPEKTGVTAVSDAAT